MCDNPPADLLKIARSNPRLEPFVHSFYERDLYANFKRFVFPGPIFGFLKLALFLFVFFLHHIAQHIIFFGYSDWDHPASHRRRRASQLVTRFLCPISLFILGVFHIEYIDHTREDKKKVKNSVSVASPHSSEEIPSVVSPLSNFASLSIAPVSPPSPPQSPPPFECDQKYPLIGNHISELDVFICSLLFGNPSFAAKDAFFSWPLYSYLLKVQRCMKVVRKRDRKWEMELEEKNRVKREKEEERARVRGRKKEENIKKKEKKSKEIEKEKDKNEENSGSETDNSKNVDTADKGFNSGQMTDGDGFFIVDHNTNVRVGEEYERKEKKREADERKERERVKLISTSVGNIINSTASPPSHSYSPSPSPSPLTASSISPSPSPHTAFSFTSPSPSSPSSSSPPPSSSSSPLPSSSSSPAPSSSSSPSPSPALSPTHTGFTHAIFQRVMNPLENDYTPLIFPEGTTGSGRYVTRFHRGVFLAGKPVRPFTIRYPAKYTSHSYDSISFKRLVYDLVTQFVVHCVVEVYDVYYPSEAERADPGLYARNVGKFIASKLGWPYLNNCDLKESHLLEDFLNRARTYEEVQAELARVQQARIAEDGGLYE